MTHAESLISTSLAAFLSFVVFVLAVLTYFRTEARVRRAFAFIALGTALWVPHVLAIVLVRFSFTQAGENADILSDVTHAASFVLLTFGFLELYRSLSWRARP